MLRDGLVSSETRSAKCQKAAKRKALHSTGVQMARMQS